MEFARRHKETIIDLYVNKEQSTYAVAEALGTYASKIIRCLNYLGIDRRNYKEAQKTALSTGRAEHPTKGKKTTDEAKRKIASARAKSWRSLSDKEHAEMCQLSKDRWHSMSPEEQQELRNKALSACREASRTGSRSEKYLRNHLVENGYTVEFHKRDLVPHSRLEVDLFLPEARLAIEIDGPTHFLPLYGEEKLQKQQAADTIKQGILLNNGYTVLRIRQLDKNMSLAKLVALSKIVLEMVIDIQNNPPEKDKRLIEIEVTDGEARRI